MNILIPTLRHKICPNVSFIYALFKSMRVSELVPVTVVLELVTVGLTERVILYRLDT